MKLSHIKKKTGEHPQILTLSIAPFLALAVLHLGLSDPVAVLVVRSWLLSEFSEGVLVIVALDPRLEALVEWQLNNYRFKGKTLLVP